MIGFLLHPDANVDDIKRYFRALQRAQRDIDLEPERCKHYFLKELPEKYHQMIDVSGFGPGEPWCSSPIRRRCSSGPNRWMEEANLFREVQSSGRDYDRSVSVHG
jgi:hypothetical protein